MGFLQHLGSLHGGLRILKAHPCFEVHSINNLPYLTLSLVRIHSNKFQSCLWQTSQVNPSLLWTLNKTLI